MSHFFILVAALWGFLQQDNPQSLAGMSEADIAAIADATSITPDNPSFRKILYRTGTVDPVDLQQSAKGEQDVSLAELAANPATHRFLPYTLNAKVISIKRFDFDKESARDFLSGFFFADCEAQDGTPFVLATRSSISSWPQATDLPEPQSIQFSGFFLGTQPLDFGNQFSATAQPVFVARRFAWQPDQESEVFKVDASLLALSKAGVDLSLLDIVKSRKGKPLGTREGVCFWQMLAACKHPETTIPTPRIGFAEMLSDPVNSVGKATTIQGRVRQCVPVKVTDRDVEQRLGSDTWYQLTMFPDLNGRPIQVATREGEPVVYNHAFPVTVCMVDLPDGFVPETIEGSSFVCSGFFYRIWSYPSERTENTGLSGQPSPLMMGASLQIIETDGDQLQMLLTAVLVAMGIAIAFVAWFVYRTHGGNPNAELPDKIEIGDSL